MVELYFKLQLRQQTNINIQQLFPELSSCNVHDILQEAPHDVLEVVAGPSLVAADLLVPTREAGRHDVVPHDVLLEALHDDALGQDPLLQNLQEGEASSQAVVLAFSYLDLHDLHQEDHVLQIQAEAA